MTVTAITRALRLDGGGMQRPQHAQAAVKALVVERQSAVVSAQDVTKIQWGKRKDRCYKNLVGECAVVLRHDEEGVCHVAERLQRVRLYWIPVL